MGSAWLGWWVECSTRGQGWLPPVEHAHVGCGRGGPAQAAPATRWMLPRARRPRPPCRRMHACPHRAPCSAPHPCNSPAAPERGRLLRRLLHLPDLRDEPEQPLGHQLPRVRCAVLCSPPCAAHAVLAALLQAPASPPPALWLHAAGQLMGAIGCRPCAARLSSRRAGFRSLRSPSLFPPPSFPPSLPPSLVYLVDEATKPKQQAAQQQQAAAAK